MSSSPSHIPSNTTSTVVSEAVGLRRAISSATTRRSSPASTSSLVMSDKQMHRLQSCRKFIGQPMTRVEAQEKIKRNHIFRQATVEFEFDGSAWNHQPQQGETDLISKAIQLDYGLRLRSCLLSRPSKISNSKRTRVPY